MKVKEFIEWIRPITALNPEGELVISNFQVPCDVEIEKVIISENLVTISIVPDIKKHGS